MLSGGKTPGIDNLNMDYTKLFTTLAAIRKVQDPMDLCTEELGTRELYKFVKECFRYGYDSKPDYKYLRSLLRDLIYKHDPHASEYGHKLDESLNQKKL